MNTLQKSALLLTSLAPLLPTAPLAAQGRPVPIVEGWVLAEDRGKFLEQLIPGTVDHFYFHCRHHQDLGQFDKVEPLLKDWIDRHGRSSRVVEIENRQALLTYATDPQKTLAFLRERLGLRFDHQRQLDAAAQQLPTTVDQAQLSTAAYAARALQRSPLVPRGFASHLLPGLLGQARDIRMLRAILNQLEAADVPNLSTHVLRELRDRRSAGFGSLGIHKKLFKDQLEALAESMPSLLGNDRFVDSMLRRLLPSEDRQDLGDEEVRAAHLDRLMAFVQRLPGNQNSLRAHVLYHKLAFDERSGKVDAELLRSYLRLPRQASYVRREYLRSQRDRSVWVRYARTYATGLPPVRSDVALVGRLLRQLFVGADNYSAFAELLDERYLRTQFAEAKILAGIGDMDRWYQLLDNPSYYQQLRRRVDLDFVAGVRQRFAAEEKVVLQLDVKNVQSLLVKVFEINALNYYQQKGMEVDASIDLDGLVANKERNFRYAEPPLRRVRRSFELDELSRPGIYVVEFIGNGMSSRAVIHKGQLLHTERLGAAGHVVTVRDTAGQPQPGAEVWFAGRRHIADQQGEVVLPFSTQPGSKTLVLRQGRVCSLRKLDHKSESFQLLAGVHLEREQLRARGKARLLLRPQLRLHGVPVSLELLERPRLHISATDAEGVEVRLDVAEPKLENTGEFSHELMVPAGLRNLQVHLRGRVKLVSRSDPQELRSATQVFQLNGIDATPMTGSPVLGRGAAGWYLDYLGKNGEPRANQPLRLTFQHRDFSHGHSLVVKTDAQGRVALGVLRGIASVHAQGLPNPVDRWHLPEDAARYPRRLRGRVGEVLGVPYVGAASSMSRQVASLIEMRAGMDQRDAFSALSLRAGRVELSGLEAGDYRLKLHESGAVIYVQVTAGPRVAGVLVGGERMLPQADIVPLNIQELRLDATDLAVQLQGTGPGTRLIVVASRYLPAYDPFAALAHNRIDPGAQVVKAPMQSDYQSGRRIGEEYRYILERRLAKKYPGNMLPRPGLILNPWVLDDVRWNTAMGLGGGAGGKFGGRRGGRARRSAPGSEAGSSGVHGLSPQAFANLDWLAEGAVVLHGLRPDAAGRVRVPLKDLGPGAMIQVLALDAEQTVIRTVFRGEAPRQRRPRHLRETLTLDTPLSEQRKIEFVAAGQSAVVQATDATRAQVYDSLRAVHGLFRSLSGNQDLDRFAFVLDWPKFDAAKKAELYERFACHELHVFLHEKDPEFFRAVVAPFLRNKQHQTFMDHWLLGEDLRGYLEPYAFGRLNVVEKILLAQRLGGEGVRKFLGERFALLDRDPAKLARLFDTVLKAKNLEGKAGFAPELARLQEQLKRVKSETAKDKDEDARNSDEVLLGATRRAAGRSRGRGAPARTGGEVSEEKAAEREVLAEELEEAEPEDSVESAFDSNAWNRAVGLGRKEQALRHQRMRNDVDARKRVQALFRALDPTKPLVEHNYWHVRQAQTLASLVDINGFWHDFAMQPAGQPFFSANLAEATGNFAEMMLALAFLDLPFESAKHETEVDGSRLTLKASSPLLLARREVVASQKAEGAQSILCSQNYFRLAEPYRMVGNQRLDAYIRDEFLVGEAYGCRVVVTNTSSAPVALDLLLQIPKGAIPVQNGFYTRGRQIRLGPYATQAVEYAFYFPAAGEQPCYPVQVTKRGAQLAAAEPFVFTVRTEPSKVDETSWAFVSQRGSAAQVLSYLDTHNLARVDLSQILWRLSDEEFFGQLLGKLRARHVYHDQVWSYALRHGERQGVAEFLRHQDGFVNACGLYLDSPLLRIDPVDRHRYEHMEFSPLVNARAHQNGARRIILDQNLWRQYWSFMGVLAARPQLSDADRVQACYYLLLQDRVAEALAQFDKVDPGKLRTRLQYDYLQAYLAFSKGEVDQARRIAARYAEYPVRRWSKLFAAVQAQADEIQGRAVAQVDPKSREEQLAAQADRAPSLELVVENQEVKLSYANVEACEIRYYAMDVEFLFSSQPFVQQSAGSFAFIQPNLQEERALPKGQDSLSFALPAQFRSANVLIEARAGGVVRRQTYFARSMSVAWMENQGQLQVSRRQDGGALSTVYVKVFARMPDGRVRFFKDGYTDRRGRFDYASLSAPQASSVQRFSVLVLSDEHGAQIREIEPPAQ